MTRILGLDIYTGSYGSFKIEFSGCLVDTINNAYQVFQTLTVDQLIELLQQSPIDILAIDHINELRHDPRLVEYLADSDYPTVAEISRYDTIPRTLSQLAKEVGISLKSKPNSLKSAIICALLAEEHGNYLEVIKQDDAIKFERIEAAPNNGASNIVPGNSSNPLNRRVRSRQQESTHRAVFHDLQNSTFVKEVKQVIGYGKEAIVYWVEDIQDRDVVVKTFRTYSSIARRIHSETYKAKSAHIPLIMARDEAKYLSILDSKNIAVPKVYYRDDNTVGMEAILNDTGTIAPTLTNLDTNELDVDEIQHLLYQALDYLYLLFDDASIVHGDYSANNLLVRNEDLVIIDLSQARRINTNTFVNTPQRLRMDKALQVLFRDLDGILTFFEKEFRIKLERDTIFDEFLTVIPEIFADKVEFTAQQWQGKFR